MDHTQTDKNRAAWEAGRYDAWIAAYGSPAHAAAQIQAEPEHVLRRLRPHLGPVAGQRLCSVQGSHGRVAVAFAMLGAAVTVVGFASANRRYALELAAAAGVDIAYTLADILKIDTHHPHDSFDCLVLEMGILHYHSDLSAFFGALSRVAKQGATLIINEFHPVQRKLYWTSGPANYFAHEMVQAEVPNPNQNGPALGHCDYRFWTLGEIVTACIQAGFCVTVLHEHPDDTDPGIPGSFTLLATAL